MNLKSYNKKRNFNNTSEPEGKQEKNKNTFLSFVVQHHIARANHYDFRLEWKGVLLSWAVPKGPSYNPKDKRLAVMVEPHPLDYGSFEGNIPKGEYGGGSVMLWDSGHWEPVGNVDKSLKDGSLKFTLLGKRLMGKWALVKLKSESDNNWLLVKDTDEYARTDFDITKVSTSIKTKKTMEQIAADNDNKNSKKNIESEKKDIFGNKKNTVIKDKPKNKNENINLTKNPFKKVNVQLVKLVDEVPKGNWIYELKYDGYRIVAYIENGSVRLLSRNNIDYTKHFEHIVNSLAHMGKNKSMVLDGEIVIADESGISSFQLLQNHIRQAGKFEPSYVVFDLLALDGDDLRNQPLMKRKNKLKELLKSPTSNIIYSKEFEGDGDEIFNNACDFKTEGIIAKLKNSVYSGTRNGDWVKLKCNNSQEFVIGGYTKSEKNVGGVSSLLLGYYENNTLIYAGRTGTGMSLNTRRELQEVFDANALDSSPFNKLVKKTSGEKIFYTKPLHACVVQFANWTDENQLRQASFKGLRKDKNVKDIVKEYADEKSASNKPKSQNKSNKTNAPKVSDITITSPDKIVYKNPKTKKIDLVKYYEKISKKMLPYISNRIVSIKRCPDGISSECFYERNYNYDLKGISQVSVTKDKSKTNYFSVNDIFGLINMAQLNAIEFHIWGCTVDSLDSPDLMVFDLDPDVGLSLEKVRQGVKDLHALLKKLSLTAFLKTSGGKGYHIVVPFTPSVNWEKFSAFAKNVAKLLEQKNPNRYTSNIRKVNRKNKIFIDWARNSKSSTCIAPYSLRIKKGAPISFPISWSDLDHIAPDQITMFNYMEYSKKNPWKNFFNTHQQLQ